MADHEKCGIGETSKYRGFWNREIYAIASLREMDISDGAILLPRQHGKTDARVT
jgi:hypothetical protein